MSKPIDPNTKTGQITLKAIELMKQNPDGIKWADLNRKIEESDPSLHPKTINGTVWKLPEKFPNNITKEKGLFKWRE